MNRIYRLVWNRRRGRYVAAAETAAAAGKSAGGLKGLPAALVAAMACAAAAHAAGPAAALPAGARVVAGGIQVTSSGATMTVRESTSAAIIDWQSFSIGAGATVNVLQPGPTAVLLNRVVGGQPSAIWGRLTANGEVFLLNSSGILIGRGARVEADAFLASTLDIADAEFLAGRGGFQANGARPAAVTNQGTIRARDGGFVALLGGQVVNEGLIQARLGTVALAAGDRISLHFAGNGTLGVAVDRGTLAALVANRDAIVADGGTVELTARGVDAILAAAVNDTGLIQARTVGHSAGHIYLLGDRDSATVSVSGSLDASAPDGGDGGTIETSAARVTIDPAARVDTAARSGLTGSWLVDPVDFTIAASGGDISGATLSSQLLTTNVSLSSTNGASGSQGNLNVDDAVSWNANKLTLTAVGDVNINAVMKAGGTAQLDLEPGSGNVNFGFKPDGTFLGRVDFVQADGVTPRAGTGFLTISGQPYTVITSLGQAADATSAPATPTLQGIAAVTPVTMGNYSAIPGNYALGANIDASATGGWNGGAGFTPIGVGNYVRAFGGNFDGLGHVVSNLTINLPNSPDVGLFAFAIGTNGGFIRNVGLTGAAVAGTSHVGALVGYGYGAGGTFKVSNSFTTGSVTAATVTANYGATAGGLVGGFAYGAIANSHSGATVSATGLQSSNAGGLVGMIYTGTVDRSYATGNVSNTGLTSFPGFGGYAGTNTISGGLIGFLLGNATVSNSFATGNVSASRNGAGGLVGYNYGSIVNSYATGNVSGVQESMGTATGGLVGFQSGSVSNCYETGTVTATSAGNPVTTGALVGSTTGGASIANSYWNSTANGSTGYTVFSGSPTVTGSTGLSLAQMNAQASYVPSGAATGQWDFTGTWFIYEGSTTPLLRAFLTPLSVSAGGTLTYNGQLQTGAVILPAGADPSHVLGTPAYSGGGVNVGAYSVTPVGLYSDQLGYLLQPGAGTLDITPATLTYVATPATQSAGNANHVFAGTVSGFVGGDSLAGATTGTLVFSSATTASTPAGAYAITGSGLTANAGDYVFVQAPANATALTITGSLPGSSGQGASGSGAPGAAAAGLPGIVAAAQQPIAGVPNEVGQGDMPTEASGTQPAGTAVVAGGPALAIDGVAPGTPMQIVSSPAGAEPSLVVTLSQASALIQPGGGDAGSGGGAIQSGPHEVRVPVGRNSLAEIVNGGVKLPDGVEQQLFVVAR